MKRPSFQFYPEAWQTNANLKRCTKQLKCTWLDVMCLMHDSDEYGVLRWPLREVAEAAACKIPELKELRTKSVLKGADAGETCPAFIYTPRHAGKDGDPVTLIPEQPGPVWYSSRMVRDEYIRSKRGEGTRFGDDPSASGRPQKRQKAPPNQTPTQRVGDQPDKPPTQREGDGPLALSLSLGSKGNGEGSAVQPSLAVEMALALRSAGVRDAHGLHPSVIGWIESGVTLEQAKEAARIAVHDRGKKAPTCGYLVGILQDMRTPANTLNGSAPARDWWDTSEGIKAEAIKHDISIEGHSLDWLRCAIAVKVGGDKWPWIDPRNGTEERFINEIRQDQIA